MFCDCEGACEYGEPVRCYRGKETTARIPHTCYECGGKIRPGTKYLRATWFEPEGECWEAAAVCQGCHEVAGLLRDKGCCVLPGDMWTELRESVKEGDGDVSLADLDGLSPAAADLVQRLVLDRLPDPCPDAVAGEPGEVAA
ncbi:MAG: hypothetical protein AB7D57_06690 [Desulfovibrionaceae bacterium]